MRGPDLSAYAERVVVAVKNYVRQAHDGLALRMDALEAQLKTLPVPAKGDKGDSGESIRGEPGPAGKDADPEVVLAMIVSEISKAVAAMPPVQKGDKGDPGAEVDPVRLQFMVDEATARAIGTAVSLIPKAKDGDPGKDGTSVHPDTIALMVRDAADKLVAAMPKPKDGADGFGLEDFDMTLGEDGRTLSLKFERGELVKERSIKLETTKYLGVWREGQHDRGDVVTWGGSCWHCNRTTTEKPAYGCSDWTLMVKEGRPGKDGTVPSAPQHKVVKTA